MFKILAFKHFLIRSSKAPFAASCRNLPLCKRNSLPHNRIKWSMETVRAGCPDIYQKSPLKFSNSSCLWFSAAGNYWSSNSVAAAPMLTPLDLLSPRGPQRHRLCGSGFLAEQGSVVAGDGLPPRGERLLWQPEAAPDVSLGVQPKGFQRRAQIINQPGFCAGAGRVFLAQ